VTVHLVRRRANYATVPLSRRRPGVPARFSETGGRWCPPISPNPVSPNISFRVRVRVIRVRGGLRERGLGEMG